MRTDVHKPTEAAPAQREVPPAEQKQVGEAPTAPRNPKTGITLESLNFEQQTTVRTLTRQGVHRHKAIQLAATYPAKTIALALHQLNPSGPGVKPKDVVANLQRLRAKNIADAEQERQALHDFEDRRRHRVEAAIWVHLEMLALTGRYSESS